MFPVAGPDCAVYLVAATQAQYRGSGGDVHLQRPGIIKPNLQSED